MDALNQHADLFPRIEPYETGMLDLDGYHRMYWEQSGNPRGAPVVFVHGGPGAGAGAIHRRFFDPAHYRIIIFDQRGACRSKPFADLKDNTTPHLVADMDQLRQHLGIEQWLLFGGSWGATLALAYGIAHAERCLGFVLRGIFLGGDEEIDWFLNRMGAVFPEARRDFVEFLPEAERGDLLASYHRRLTDEDPSVHLPAAKAWGGYESACSNLIPENGGGPITSGASALDLARIEAHYFVNRVFMAENHLLDNIHRLGHLPAVIVQGRYDIVCPIATADALARAWAGAEYVIVPEAGHSALEPGIRSALVKATEGFRNQGFRDQESAAKAGS